MKNYQNLETERRSIIQAVEANNTWRSSCINLIASENVMSPLAEKLYLSDFLHRYAEGEPFHRYYNGTKYIDLIESEVQGLMGNLLNAEYVDVRPISGTVANFAVFSSLAKPGDAMISLSTPSGGHISHNKYGAPTALGLKVYNYPFDVERMNIDVDKTRRELKLIDKRPKLFVLGASLFLFPHPVKEIKEIANEYNARLVYDAAHVLGLIAGGKFQAPLEEGADIITSSTHKTFPGPQGGIVATNRDDLFTTIKKGVFPRLTSNHHLHRIPSLGITAIEMMEFGKNYASQIVKNAKALGEACYELGIPVIAEELGFTESHQIAIDVSKIGLKGKEAADLCEEANVIINKNLLPGEPLKNVKDPNGVRIGVQEMTRFGMKESEMKTISGFLKRLWIDKENPTKVREDVVELRKNYSNVLFALK